MLNKVIDLFGNKMIVPNEGTKYSDLLNDFIKPFWSDFPEDMGLDDMFYYAVQAWNLGNLSMLVPEKEFKKALSSAKLSGFEGKTLNRMIANKKSQFAEYDRFIADFTLEGESGEFRLTVMTQENEAFLEELMNLNLNKGLGGAGTEEGYINRYAIILKPRQPFFNWINALYPEEPIHEVDEPNIYLVDDNIDNMEQWLKKKFDMFFMMELEEWHSNKKEWPQNRSYKMFKEWFRVDASTMIYDLESRPVEKEN